MGIDIELWRARIGLFSGGRSRGGRPAMTLLSAIRLYLQRLHQQTNKNGDVILTNHSMCSKAKDVSPSGKTSKVSAHRSTDPPDHTVQHVLYLVIVVYCLCYYCCYVESNTKLAIETPVLLQPSRCPSWTKFAMLIVVSLVVVTVFLLLLLIMAGDVELNPGPQQSLTVSDLRVVVNKLAPVKHKWYHIGIQLGMRNEELRSLQSDHKFHEMLEIWLKGGTGVPTTWLSLVEALKSPDVGKPELGEELQKCYCLQLEQEAVPEPLTVDTLLTKFDLSKDHVEYEVEGAHLLALSRSLSCWRELCPFICLEEPEVTQIEYDCKTEPDKRLKTLHKWHQKHGLNAKYRLLLEAFLKIDRCDLAKKVCELLVGSSRSEDNCEMSTSQVTGSVDQSIDSPTKVCTSEAESQLPVAVDADEPPVLNLKRTLPNLSVSGMSETKMKEVGQKLWLESSELSCKYHTMCSALYKSLKKNDDAKDDLTACLFTMDTLLPVSQTSNQPVFEDQKLKLFEAKNLREVWFIMSFYHSYFNYYLIEHIADMLGSDDDKENVSSYKQAFAVYAKRRVYECPKEFGYENQDDCTLIVKLDKTHDKCTLEQLKLFEKKLCDILELSPNGSLRLCTVEKGCYELTFQAPSFVQETVFPLSTQQEAALKALGVVWLLCGDYEYSSQHNQDADDSSGDEDDRPDDASQGTTLFERIDQVLQRPKTSPGSTSDSGLGKSNDAHTETKSLISDFSEDMHSVELQFHESPKEQTSFVSTQLNVAAYNGNLTVVKSCTEVLHHDPSQLDNQGYTTLHIAADGGQLEIVKFLVEENNMSPARETANGRTALHIAAFNGHLHLVQYFVEVHKVDPMLQDKKLHSPLHDACRNGNADVVRYIITQAQQHETIENIISDSTRLGSTILHFAAASGSSSLVQLLLSEFQLSPDVLGQLRATPLHVAAQEGHLNVVEYLSSLENCNVFHAIQKHEQNALHFAASRGHIAIVKFLTAKMKLDPRVTDSAGRTPLHLAALNGHLTVLRFLVEDCKCDMLCLTKKRYTPLHIAAMEGHTHAVKYFTLQRKIDPLCKNINSITPLHLAVKASQSKVVSLYIKDLKVNLLNGRLGEKLLVKAVYHGNLAIVRDIVDTQNWTTAKTGFRQNQLLRNAVGMGHLEVLKYFILEKSWEFIPMLFNGQSSLLHLAAIEGHLEIVNFLIAERKSNPDSTDYVGLTPLHRACQGGHSNIVHYLLDDCKADNCPLSLHSLTPLHFSAMAGHCHIVELLTQSYGVDPLCSDIDGNTSLDYAAGQGNLDVVKFFISRINLDPNLANKNGATPLHYACENGRTDVVSFLLEQQECSVTIQDKNKCASFLYAVMNGHLNIIKLMIARQKLDPTWRGDEGRSLLHYASSNGQIDMVKYLVSELSTDPNILDYKKTTPLMPACLIGHEDVVKLECKCPMTTDSNGFTPLHYAAIEGKLNIVEFFTTQMQLDPNCRDNLGRTPLHYAAIKFHLKMVTFLVKQLKCDSNVQDNLWQTPLHLVAGFENLIEVDKVKAALDYKTTNLLSKEPSKVNSLDVFKYFVEDLKSNPFLPNLIRQTPLHGAALSGKLSIVKYFVSQLKVDLNTQDIKGITPLHLACQNGQKGVIDCLLSDSRCDKNPRNLLGQSPLHYAVIRGNLDIIMYLIREKHCDPMCRDLEGHTLLHYSAQNGHFNIAKFLVNDLHCDPGLPNFNGATPLHHASINGNIDIVKFLTLEKQCDPMCREAYSNTPIFFAVRNEHFDIVNFFITKLKLDPLTSCECKKTLLHEAASVGNMKIWNFLMSQLRKHDINKVSDEYGLTPFHVASSNGNIDIVKQLLVDCSQPLDNDMRTPLHYAARYNHLDIVKLITLVKQFDPMCKDGDGNTPLHLAAKKGNKDIVDFYVDVLKCSLYTTNKNGESPFFLLYNLTVSEQTISTGPHILHIAAEQGKMIIIQYLLDNGMNPNILDNLKRTPLHYAAMGGKLKAAEALLQVGADPLAEDVFHNLPLHYAAALGHHEVVKLLVQNGSHRETKGIFYLTPFKMAMIGDHHDIGELLIKSITTLK